MRTYRLKLATIVVGIALMCLPHYSAADTYPGIGVMTAGDLWETFQLQAFGPSYQEVADNPEQLYFLVRLGNLERQWTTPTMMYPSQGINGTTLHIPWKAAIEMIEMDKDAIQNGTVFNPNSFAAGAEGSPRGSYDNRASAYAYGFYTSKVAAHPGAVAVTSNGDAAGGVPLIDGFEQVYTATTPTNLGVNVEMTVRSYSLNWGNFNDFVTVEFKLTNTGQLDVDGDGTLEATDNVIDALVLNFRNEPINSMTNRSNGRRGGSGWGRTPLTGYDGSPVTDTNAPDAGEPWALAMSFSGAGAGWHGVSLEDGSFAAGANNIGQTKTNWGTYLDIRSGYTWIAAVDTNGNDKTNVFGTDLIGKGSERGWYLSAGRGYENDTKDFWVNHTNGMATWYNSGNHIYKTPEGTYAIDQTPDQNFFDVGANADTADIWSWVPKAVGERRRPNGDMKYGFVDNTGRPAIIEREHRGGAAPSGAAIKAAYASASAGEAVVGSEFQYGGGFRENYEHLPAAGPGSYTATADWQDGWTEGFSHNHGFDGDLYVGIGPISLEVGETVVITGAEAAGYRLDGLRGAIRAARYAHGNDYDLDAIKPPTPPDITVQPVIQSDGTLGNQISWSNGAAVEADANFSGYKVYRASLIPKFGHIRDEDGGIGETGKDNRAMLAGLWDTYQKQTVPTPNEDPVSATWAFAEKINPYYDSFNDKQMQAGPSGPWQLVASLSAGASEWTDNSNLVAGGFSYWYYVAASSNKSGSIPGIGSYGGGDPIESHRVNVNGANGVWQGTYSHATASSFYPTSAAGTKAIGATYVATTPVTSERDLARDGADSSYVRIGVRPNPYKVQALHDGVTSHRLLFYNLPANAKISIYDVSGQVIDVLNFDGTEDASNGTMFWNMFSKDGIEVVSGLYIFVAEFSGGSQTGYFSILR